MSSWRTNKERMEYLINLSQLDVQIHLSTAVEEGILPAVQEIVEAGASVNKLDQNGNTPLIIVSYFGHIDVLRFLIKAGANVNQAINGGDTPLYMAAQNGHVNVVKVLVDAGGSVDQADDIGTTPLSIASQQNHVNMVKALVEARANGNQAKNNGATPLYIVAQNGNIEIVIALLDAGASVDQATDNGATPLFIAALNGHVEVVRALLQRGADPSKSLTRDVGDFFQGMMSIDVAQDNGHMDVVELLRLAIAKKTELIPALMERVSQKKDEKSVILGARSEGLVNKDVTRRIRSFLAPNKNGGKKRKTKKNKPKKNKPKQQRTKSKCLREGKKYQICKHTRKQGIKKRHGKRGKVTQKKNY